MPRLRSGHIRSDDSLDDRARPPVQNRFSAQEIARQLDHAGYAHVQADLSLRNHSMVWAERPLDR